MSNYATLKGAIADVVKTNGNNEITGALLQQSLLAMINSLGADYQFVGIAEPATNPGTPDQNVFYIAGAGTYPNFNSSVVPDGHLGALKYNGSWTLQTIFVGKNYDAIITRLTKDVDDLNRVFVETLSLTAAQIKSNYNRRYYQITEAGQYGTNTNYYHRRIPVKPGDVVEVTANSEYGTRFCFLKSNDAPQSGGDIDLCVGSSTIGVAINQTERAVAPEDALYLAVNSGYSTGDYYYTPESIVIKSVGIQDQYIKTRMIADGAITSDKIAPGTIELEISGQSSKYVSFNVFDSSKAQMGYINKNTGAFVSLSSGEYRATDFIPVSQIVRSYNYKTYGSVGGHAVYDSNKQYIRSTGATYSYVDGDAFVRFTITVNATYKFILYEDLNITGAFAPTYQEQIITPFSGSQIIAKENVPSLIPAFSSVGQDGAGVSALTLDSSLSESGGNRMNISNFPYYLKSNRIVSFTAKITTAGTFDIGVGRGSSLGFFVRVDSTYIDIRKYTGTGTNSTSISKQAHGLIIASFITVIFTIQYKKFSVNIVSSNGQFNYSMDDELREQYGYAFVEVLDGAVVTNSVLRVVSDRMRKPVWIVGDSYTSIYAQRWPYQLINGYGIDQFTVIGLAGGTSEDMFPALQNALLYGTPKFLVWALGMNDSYWKWKDIVIKVEMLCRALGIELILQTIPWPTDGSKASINNYVKSSGYRYVDVYDAVSSDDNGTWYSGMLDDGVHPTTFGAKAIAGRYLVDFPEIAQ
jgi:hypothetical protein